MSTSTVRRRICHLAGISIFVAGGCITAASAHEYIVKPAIMTAAAGTELPIAALSTHVFMVSQELEKSKDVKAGLFFDSKRIEVPVKPNQETLSHDGEIKAPTNASFIVTGARLPQIWATTPEGLKEATKKTPGASNAYKIEKFSKALVNVSVGDNGFATSVGDTLEIVLVSNPATIKPGDELTVKVLYKGQPLTTSVYATYDGFSKEENTYAYYTECHKDGTAKVKITQPGLWMVRVQHTVQERTEDYDRWVGRAIVLFEVKG